jgi:hypothetical protein
MTYHTQILPSIKPQPFMERLDIKSIQLSRARILGGIQTISHYPKNRRLKISSPRQTSDNKSSLLTVKTKTKRPTMPKSASSVVSGVGMT